MHLKELSPSTPIKEPHSHLPSSVLRMAAFRVAVSPVLVIRPGLNLLSILHMRTTVPLKKSPTVALSERAEKADDILSKMKRPGHGEACCEGYSYACCFPGTEDCTQGFD